MNKDKLTKAEIIDKIYDTLEPPSKITRKEIQGIIDGLFHQIKNALSEDKVIELRGFGTFEVRIRKGRERARNPRTGEIVPVDTHGVAAFRPGRELKNLVWPLPDSSQRKG